MFINNNGTLNIDDVNVSTEIFYGDAQPIYNHDKSQFNPFLQEDVPYGINSIILNDKILNISNRLMLNTICRSFIFSSNKLSMSTMLVSQAFDGEYIYNPNSRPIRCM